MLYRHFPSKKALLAAAFEEEVWGGGPGSEARHPLRPDPALALPDLLEARLGDPETATSARLVRGSP